MEPPRRPMPSPWSPEAAEADVWAVPPGWDDYREARARFLRTLQIDSLNRLLSRPEVDSGGFRPDRAR